LVVCKVSTGANVSIELIVEKLAGMIRVGEAAKFLGILKQALRNGDKSVTLAPTRHSVTGYRYYRQVDLDAFLKSVIAVQTKASK
jgi:hypothetical protein